VKSGAESRNSVRCNSRILSRWHRKGEQFESSIESIAWSDFEPSQTFHARRAFRSEEFHELERRVSRIEEKLNTLFGFFMKQQTYGLLEGPFLGDISGLGIRFGTRKIPPEPNELLEIEILLEGPSVILFKSELEVLRIEPSDDGAYFIAGRFIKMEPEVQEQIVRFAFQCQKEEIRASREEV